MTNTSEHPVIIFDGICNLCNGSVQFVIKKDPTQKFRFASLQGSFGQNILNKYHLPNNQFNSVILLQNEKLFFCSTAVLKIARQLKGLWPTLYVLMIIPKFMRDSLYNFIANRRYKWFGKKEYCMIPDKSVAHLFYD